jgi:hypothetical protein
MRVADADAACALGHGLARNLRVRAIGDGVPFGPVEAEG